MKKKYLRLLVLCAFAVVSANAQLNGVYTINNTIAQSASNFTSFTSFAAALNTSGLNGPVTVNVLANAVFTEQVNFNQATGISPTNTVTINGNGATVTFSNTTATLRHTIMLTGADYMTFNNLTISGTNGTNALSCHLWSGANNNAFNSCVFTATLVGTGTTLVPFSISGTSVSATGTGTSGNNNVVSSCTVSGGYYGVVFYGVTAAPFANGNMVLNSSVVDFYSTGIYNVYNTGSIIRGNIVERPLRNAITSSEGIYLSTSSSNCIVERNHVRRMGDGVLASTSTIHGIYISGDASLGNENIIRNNIVSDCRSNGTQGGIYVTGGAYAQLHHNTINLDDNSSTAGTTYGIYSTGPNNSVRNNIVTILRSGSGSKYCLYYTTASAVGLVSDNNVLVITSAATNSVASLTNGYATLAAWKLANPNYDQLSSDSNPLYTNVSLMNYVPTSTVINNMCPFIGVIDDYVNFTRSTATPDPGAYEFYTTACTGAAPSNSVIVPGYVMCPNLPLSLQLANTFTNIGYNVQWQISTQSALGPFNAIPGATLPVFNTSTITSSSFFNVLISCINGGNTVTAAVGQVSIALPTTNTVPYFENFEGISVPNQLPNCSWANTNSGGTTLTYTTIGTNNRVPRSGTKFASFANSPSGASYFYSNGIYMSPGITYSASVWYINESIGYNNWSDFSMLIGQSQSSVNLATIATTTLSAVIYTPLTNTFTVNSPGLYYIAIRATSSPGNSPYLTWDDLSVIIPCSLNSPTLILNSSVTNVCSGQNVTMNVLGANSYSWSSGQTGSLVVVAPPYSTNYFVTGTNTLSGCASSVSQSITVSPAPQLAVLASSIVICSGQPVNIFAFGASNYNWSHGPFGSSVVVTPTVTTTYSVIGVNSFSCSATQSIVITVNPVPVINALSSTYNACKGEPVTFTGNGANNFQWASSPSVIFYGNPVTITAQNSGSFTVIGTDANGCDGSTSFILSVDDCTGIMGLTKSRTGICVYPNPGNGIYKVSLDQNTGGIYVVFDLAGKQVSSGSFGEGQASVNIQSLANGVYILRLDAHGTSNFLRLIKNE